jgi:hypothetical protein
VQFLFLVGYLANTWLLLQGTAHQSAPIRYTARSVSIAVSLCFLVHADLVSPLLVWPGLALLGYVWSTRSNTTMKETRAGDWRNLPFSDLQQRAAPYLQLASALFTIGRVAVPVLYKMVAAPRKEQCARKIEVVAAAPTVVLPPQIYGVAGQPCGPYGCVARAPADRAMPCARAVRVVRTVNVLVQPVQTYPQHQIWMVEDGPLGSVVYTAFMGSFTQVSNDQFRLVVDLLPWRGTQTRIFQNGDLFLIAYGDPAQLETRGEIYNCAKGQRGRLVAEWHRTI